MTSISVTLRDLGGQSCRTLSFFKRTRFPTAVRPAHYQWGGLRASTSRQQKTATRASRRRKTATPSARSERLPQQHGLSTTHTCMRPSCATSRSVVAQWTTSQERRLLSLLTTPRRAGGRARLAGRSLANGKSTLACQRAILSRPRHATCM